MPTTHIYSPASPIAWPASLNFANTRRVAIECEFQFRATMGAIASFGLILLINMPVDPDPVAGAAQAMWCVAAVLNDLQACTMKFPSKSAQ
jgi:hypothetical protein